MAPWAIEGNIYGMNILHVHTIYVQYCAYYVQYIYVHAECSCHRVTLHHLYPNRIQVVYPVLLEANS